MRNVKKQLKQNVDECKVWHIYLDTVLKMTSETFRREQLA